MTLLPEPPEDRAATHLNKILSAAYESGLPVSRSITPQGVKKCILDKVAPEDVMNVDHQIVHDSYWLARRSGKKWGPWHIAEIIMDRREAEHRDRLKQEAESAQHNQLAVSLAASKDIDKDKKAFIEWKKALTINDQQRIINKWRQKVGANLSGGDLVLKWEWKEMQENE